jgi:hypothetical protein
MCGCFGVVFGCGLAAYVSKVLGFALNPLKDEFLGAKPAPGTKGIPRRHKENQLA